VRVEEESVIQNIVELANEAGLDDVNDDDVEELLQHSESLSNDKTSRTGRATHPE
jgi:hypothetical protein